MYLDSALLHGLQIKNTGRYLNTIFKYLMSVKEIKVFEFKYFFQILLQFQVNKEYKISHDNQHT